MYFTLLNIVNSLMAWDHIVSLSSPPSPHTLILLLLFTHLVLFFINNIICDFFLEEKLEQLEKETTRRQQQQQTPAAVKFESFLSATNQLAELDTLKSQLTEVKVRLKGARTEVVRLDQVGLLSSVLYFYTGYTVKHPSHHCPQSRCHFGRRGGGVGVRQLTYMETPCFYVHNHSFCNFFSFCKRDDGW